MEPTNTKTKDIVHVQQRLGHRCIENTMIYITINETLYELGSDQYYSATAKTVAEASKLVETGFEYVCSFGENRLFRKRK